jgi:BirA family biotin operon repressor/biotin-[acetyl-CoA-carboxylase] ligase
MPDQLHVFDLAEVNSAIAATEFAGSIKYFSTVASTNDLAHQAAQTGARHGVWIAGEQTAGRGRGAHTWHSAPGSPQEPAGLYMTALIAPPIPMQSALSLSLRVAIAVQSAIASIAGFRIRDQIDIRWPNDLLLNGKKCGGILIETASTPAAPPLPPMLRYAILGIGINLNHTTFPPGLDPIATSLRRELSDHLANPESFTRSVENGTKCLRRELPDHLANPESFTRSVENGTKCLRREPLAAAILVALDDQLRALATDNRQLTTDNSSRYSSWIRGKRVRVEPRDGGPGYTGTTAGLDAYGFLLVQGDDGQLHTVLSGGLREP